MIDKKIVITIVIIITVILLLILFYKYNSSSDIDSNEIKKILNGAVTATLPDQQSSDKTAIENQVTVAVNNVINQYNSLITGLTAVSNKYTSNALANAAVTANTALEKALGDLSTADLAALSNSLSSNKSIAKTNMTNTFANTSNQLLPGTIRDVTTITDCVSPQSVILYGKDSNDEYSKISSTVVPNQSTPVKWGCYTPTVPVTNNYINPQNISVIASNTGGSCKEICGVNTPIFSYNGSFIDNDTRVTGSLKCGCSGYTTF